MSGDAVYHIMVEGGLHDTVDTLAKAKRIQRKYQAEGWNVTIVKEIDTALGVMGVDV